MPDIRIKDLTTTASSTASDDFFAADGATNGTRKLSAYSPTFGGNATVGGTLTVTGALTTSSIVNNGANGVALDTGGSASLRFTDSATSKWWIYKLSGDPVLYFRDMVNARMQMVMSPGATSSAAVTTLSSRVFIEDTTASTSTSSGALVVGNGTSGGLGVGGAIWGGGKVHVGSAGYVDGGAKLNVYATPSDAGYLYGIRLSDNSTATLALGLQTPTGTTSSFIHSNIALGFGTVGTAALNINTSQQVQVLASTASTSTSSGALVVSGGVGVAKRIFTGEGLDTAGDNATHISLVRNGTISIGPTSAATPKLQVGGGLLLANTSQSVPAYGDVGPQLSVAGAVITDTSSSGTVSRAVVNSIAASALAASSTTTYTAAASLFVAGAPTANTNVTITNAYAIYTAGGRINFQGLPTSSAGLQAGTLWNDGGTLKIA
jgi:hypothetical protein